MKSLFPSYLTVLALVPLTLALEFPQAPASPDGGTIYGAVTTLGPDNQPVNVPGVQVAIRCESRTRKLWTVVTDEDGRFSLLGLPIDKCSATASAQGFRSETKIGRTTNNSALELSFQLEMLTVAERRG